MQSVQLSAFFHGVTQDELAVEIAVQLPQCFSMTISDTHAVDDKIVTSNRTPHHWDGPYAD